MQASTLTSDKLAFTESVFKRIKLNAADEPAAVAAKTTRRGSHDATTTTTRVVSANIRILSSSSNSSSLNNRQFAASSAGGHVRIPKPAGGADRAHERRPKSQIVPVSLQAAPRSRVQQLHSQRHKQVSPPVVSKMSSDAPRKTPLRSQVVVGGSNGARVPASLRSRISY